MTNKNTIMKIYKYLFAAFAATMALASCTQDIADMNDTELSADGTRTISVSFGTQDHTRTVMSKDGVTPKFSNGDVIKVSNGSTSTECKIDVDGSGNASFTTTLTGKLTAVYPASAADMDGNRIVGVMVPAKQTGKFADANICMAKEITKKAVFENQTAVLKFYVDKSIGVLGIRIVNLDETTIATGSPTIEVIAEAQEEYRQVEGGTAKNKEYVQRATLADVTDDPEKRICYVSVIPGTYSELGFFSSAQSQESPVKKIYSNVTIRPGEMANVFIPYFIRVQIPIDDNIVETQYWSYCNLGAFLPEEPGYYYSWGNTDGHWLNGVSDGYAFSYEAYKSTSGARILESNILPESGSDAANVAWGDLWRMPTKSEFKKLLEHTYHYVGEEGLVVEGIQTNLCFPFTGIIQPNYGLISQAEGYKVLVYRSSTIYPEDHTTSSYCLIYPDASNDYTGIGVAGAARSFGIPIRPIYGELPMEDVGLDIDEFEDGGTLY